MYNAGSDTNKAFSEFMSNINFGISVNCPLKQIKTNRFVDRKEWLSPNILNMSQELKNLFYLTKTADNPHIHSIYKQQKK